MGSICSRAVVEPPVGRNSTCGVYSADTDSLLRLRLQRCQACGPNTPDPRPARSTLPPPAAAPLTLPQITMADLAPSQELVPSQEPDMPAMPGGRNARGRAQTKKTRVRQQAGSGSRAAAGG